MSKPARIFLLLIQMLLLASVLAGQDIEVKLAIAPENPAGVFIEGRFLNGGGGKNLSFVRSVAGFDKLGERIADVRLADSNSTYIAHKMLVPGEYLADSGFTNWRYTVNVAALSNQNSAAHISWITGDFGILMLGDLLPQTGNDTKPTSAKVMLVLPESWTVSTTEKSLGQFTFEANDVERAIFYIGKGWRTRNVPVGPFSLQLAISGDWKFSDDEAKSMVKEIFAEYRKILGSDPAERVQISITKFPTAANHGTWQAETRGRNVTIISADMAFKTQSLQRLHEQLRHEMFHLWIPNAVNLSGNYDWFYEGFALYQSLKTAVRLNRIRFDDFLDTLSRAHNIDNANIKRLSLIEASGARWSGANTQVYARGMLVAFLCDLTLLKKKRSISGIFRQLFDQHRYPNGREDGNIAILNLLRRDAELEPIIKMYISGAETIDWRAALLASGIENTGDARFTNLKVIGKLSGRQKGLLDELGYNNWRKLSKDRK